MKTQDRQIAIPARLVAVGLLTALTTVSAACSWSNPCEKPTLTCTGQPPGETFMKYDIGLANAQSGCGANVECIWANDRAEAEQCALATQSDPASWQVSPTGVMRYTVATCENATTCCEEYLDVWAATPNDARRCQTLPGWTAVGPETVDTYSISYTCYGHGTSAGTATREIVAQASRQYVTARSVGDAEGCIHSWAQRLDRVQDNSLTVTCDYH